MEEIKLVWKKDNRGKVCLTNFSLKGFFEKEESKDFFVNADELELRKLLLSGHLDDREYYIWVEYIVNKETFASIQQKMGLTVARIRQMMYISLRRNRRNKLTHHIGKRLEFLYMKRVETKKTKATQKKLLTSGTMAKALGITTQKLRYWSKKGTLIPVKIGKGNFRYYSEEQLQECLNFKK